MLKKIGITGGNGLIGKILIKILRKKKIKYTCYRNDIRNLEQLNKWIKSNRDIDTIYHLAAIVPTNLVENNKKKSISVNFNGTMNIFNTLISANKNFWFFFASTSHVYKPQKKLLVENDILKPSSFYGQTKLMSEKFLFSILPINSCK